MQKVFQLYSESLVYVANKAFSWDSQMAAYRHGDEVLTEDMIKATGSIRRISENGPVLHQLGYNDYRYLPLYAQIAIERADCDYQFRNTEKLCELIEAYARIHGVDPDENARQSAVNICSKRFWNFNKVEEAGTEEDGKSSILVATI